MTSTLRETTLRETERTYEPSDGGGFPQLAGLPGIETVVGPEEFELENVYFDTADLRLAAAGITLRHRRGGNETGWQLKLPAGGDSRDEIHVRDQRPERRQLRPPAELVALTRASTRGAVLTQVATMTTTRRRWTLIDATGGEVAEVVDDLVHGHRTGADTTAVTWREIEVELTAEGEPALLDRVDRRFSKAGMRRSDTAVKLARVLGDRWPTPPAAPKIGKRSTVSDVVLAALREHVDALRHQDPQVRLATPDSVHQMRVAARRLRSILQAYGRVIDRDRTRSLTDELKWLGEELGPARDLEVMHERFRSGVDALPAELVLGPVAAELTRVFGAQEADARTRAVAALDTDRYLALLERVDLLLTDPPLTARAGRRARKELPRQLARSHKRLVRRLRTADRAPAGTERETAFHEARKAAKRMRYATTAARPALGKPAKRLARRVKALQGVLGDHHDAVVARPVLRDLAVKAHGAGGNGFTYGLLHAQEAELAHNCERQVPGLWKKVRPAATTVMG